MNLVFKFAGLTLAWAMLTSAASAQTGHPSLFARLGKSQAMRSDAVRSEPNRVLSDRSQVSQRVEGYGPSQLQSVPSGSATVYQRGSGNAVSISQDGANNAAAIYQIGRNNTGAITQTGMNNAACILQVGRNNTASVIQTVNQSVGIAQTPRGTFEFPTVLCQLHGGDPQQLRRVVMASL